MKLLHVDSSILGANSVSRQVSAAVTQRLRAATPPLEITYRDLIATPPPHVTLAHLPDDHPLSALAAGASATELAANRAASQAILEEFIAADIVVIGAPMYNFTIPSQLKSWIDLLLVPGRTLRYGPKGVEGLAADKRVIVAISRGGLYGAGAPASAAEHAESYLRTAFGFIGVTNLEFIIAEGIQHGAEQRGAALAGALDAATALRAA